MADFAGEIPPTAGLPFVIRDLLPPWRGGLDSAAADFLSVSNAALECSGTACLVVILYAMHRLTGRRTVIVPGYTCPLVALAVAHCGLALRLCDLAPDSFELDAAALDAMCDDDTLAIIPTHLAGRVASLDDVINIARKHSAFVIEDAAQAFGAKQDKVSVGLQGDAGFFSFAAGKGLSLYEGGLWIARDPSLRAAIEQVSAMLIKNDIGMETLRCFQLLGLAALYRPSPLRVAYGLPLRRALRRNDLVAAVGDDFSARIPLHRVGRWRQSVGRSALSRLPDFQAALTAQAARRLPRLQQLAGVHVFDDSDGRSGVWPSFLLLMPSQKTRDAALARLWRRGLGVTRMFAHALCDYDYLRPLINAEAGTTLPNARQFSSRSLTLSNSLWLDDARFDVVMQSLEDVLKI